MFNINNMNESLIQYLFDHYLQLNGSMHYFKHGFKRIEETKTNTINGTTVTYATVSELKHSEQAKLKLLDLIKYCLKMVAM